jgi:hypothetical protein
MRNTRPALAAAARRALEIEHARDPSYRSYGVKRRARDSITLGGWQNMNVVWFW